MLLNSCWHAIFGSCIIIQYDSIYRSCFSRLSWICCSLLLHGIDSRNLSDSTSHRCLYFHSHSLFFSPLIEHSHRITSSNFLPLGFLSTLHCRHIFSCSTSSSFTDLHSSRQSTMNCSYTFPGQQRCAAHMSNVHQPSQQDIAILGEQSRLDRKPPGQQLSLLDHSQQQFPT